MRDPFKSFEWLCFGRRLQVLGHHNSDPLPVATSLREGFASRHSALLAKVLARPGGFDGQRAALVHWRLEGSRLSLETAQRSYTEGSTLKQLCLEYPDQVPLGLQPVEGWSWGSSLATVVLLPGNRILTGRRSRNMAAAPGRWSVLFTEVLEPGDVRPLGMGTLLSRLVEEELPTLSAFGAGRYVGLARTLPDYCWMLVAVLDLRSIDAADGLEDALAALKPDDETEAWAALGVDSLALGSLMPLGLDLVRDLVQRLDGRA